MNINKTDFVSNKDIRIIDDTPSTVSLNWTEYERAVLATKTLLKNSIEGNGEGQFKPGSTTILKSVYERYKYFKLFNISDQKVIDEAVWNLYDSCIQLETSAIAPNTNLNDKLATKETRYLFMNLQKITNKNLLFGMHDTTGYGVGWSGNDNRSDIKDVCGDFPAIFSEDINHVELDHQVERLRYRLTSAYNAGSIITLCWHQFDPDYKSCYFSKVKGKKVVSTILPGGQKHEEYKRKLFKIAKFLKSLRGKNGESIPVIFRPYHEHTSHTFWWGTLSTSKEEFNRIWQFTQEYLRDSLNVHNLIYALSPMMSDVASGDSYFNRYPGDKYVDIFGADYYFKRYYFPFYTNSKFLKGLQTIAKHSIARNKVTALTEIGNANLKTTDWFKSILKILKYDYLASNIVYAVVWRNASKKHHFAPYPGHCSVKDFIDFYNDSYTVFQHDLPNMYALPK
jgi:mannan endo-1,4-beta-mannosidase